MKSRSCGGRTRRRNACHTSLGCRLSARRWAASAVETGVNCRPWSMGRGGTTPCTELCPSQAGISRRTSASRAWNWCGCNFLLPCQSRETVATQALVSTTSERRRIPRRIKNLQVIDFSETVSRRLFHRGAAASSCHVSPRPFWAAFSEDSAFTDEANHGALRMHYGDNCNRAHWEGACTMPLLSNQPEKTA